MGFTLALTYTDRSLNLFSSLMHITYGDGSSRYLSVGSSGRNLCRWSLLSMFPGTRAVFSWMATCCFVFLSVTDAVAGHLFMKPAAPIQVLAGLQMDKLVFVG